MPITFKMKKGSVPLVHDLQKTLCDAFGVSNPESMSIGATQSEIDLGWGRIVVPLGVAHLKQGSLPDFRAKMIEAVGAKAIIAAQGSQDAVDDHEWISQQAASLSMSETPVKLAEATRLYQRVTASSGGSVYRVGILTKNVNFAFRVKDYKASVRAEFVTKNTAAHSTLVGVFGLNKKGEHYSAHFDMPSNKEFRGYVGAIYANFTDVKTKFPDVNKFSEGVS